MRMLPAQRASPRQVRHAHLVNLTEGAHAAYARARFCLHTEGNSWGTRLYDYMAMECLPLSARRLQRPPSNQPDRPLCSPPCES